MHIVPKGPKGTAETVRLALEAAREHSIRHIVVASNEGDTALLFKEAAKDIHVVCVGHAYGFKGPGQCELSPERRDELKAAGIDVLHTSHVLSGAERGLSKRYQGIGPVEIMARTLYLFGQGTKVCVEIAVMALDAGLIPHGEDVIAVGGTARGADTALVLAPAHAADILQTRVRAVICKPWDF